MTIYVLGTLEIHVCMVKARFNEPYDQYYTAELVVNNEPTHFATGNTESQAIGNLVKGVAQVKHS